MTSISVMTLTEVGADYITLSSPRMNVRVNFADEFGFSKEDSAGFFRGLVGKSVALESAESVSDGSTSFYIAVDIWQLAGNSVKVIPMGFSISTV